MGIPAIMFMFRVRFSLRSREEQCPSPAAVRKAAAAYLGAGCEPPV